MDAKESSPLHQEGQSADDRAASTSNSQESKPADSKQTVQLSVTPSDHPEAKLTPAGDAATNVQQPTPTTNLKMETTPTNNSETVPSESTGNNVTLQTDAPADDPAKEIPKSPDSTNKPNPEEELKTGSKTVKECAGKPNSEEELKTGSKTVKEGADDATAIETETKVEPTPENGGEPNIETETKVEAIPENGDGDTASIGTETKCDHILENDGRDEIETKLESGSAEEDGGAAVIETENKDK